MLYHRLDEPESWLTYFASFAVFLFFLAGLLGWGQLLSRRWLRNADGSFGLHLAAGSAGFSLWVGTAMLVLPAALLKWLIVLGAVAGCALFRPKALGPGVQEIAKDRLSLVLSAALGISVLLRVIEGFYLHAHGDAFICYLTATRSFVERGGFAAFLDNPVYFLSTSWENLYLAGHGIFHHGPGTGLIQGQRFAQWCTAAIAHLGSIAILYRLALELRASRAVALTAALAGSSVPILRWTQNLAKNDLGVAFWALAGCFLVQQAVSQVQSSRRRPLLIAAGALFGLSIIGKLSGVTILATAAVVLLWSRARAKDLLAFGFGGLLGAGPTLLRNLLFTGNPVFPWLETLFRSGKLGPSLAQNLYNLTHKTPVAFELRFLIEPFAQQPWLFAPVVLIALMSARRFRHTHWEDLRVWCAGALLGAAAFCFGILPKSELRYFGAGLMLFSALAVISVAALLPLMIASRKQVTLATAGLSVLVIALSNLPFFTLAQLVQGKYAPGSESLLHHSAGKAKKWLRERARENTAAGRDPFSVVTLGDNEEYYMLGERYHELGYYQPLDRVAGSFATGAELARFLRDSGYRYVVDARELMPWGNLNAASAALLVTELQRFPKARVFSEGGVAVYDLSQLWAVASAAL